jgi:hypothetical protein
MDKATRLADYLGNKPAGAATRLTSTATTATHSPGWRYWTPLSTSRHYLPMTHGCAP